MAGQDGEGLSTGGLEGTEAARIVAVRSNAILSFDKAETIAARRLRELAIRLRNDDAEAAATDRVPFDADRHFRERLAERMAALGTDASATEAPAPIPYAVSDALSLNALGLSKPLLAAPLAKTAPKADATQADGTPAEPSLAAADTEKPNVDTQGDPALDDDYPVFEPAVRLVDLINQQRTLVTRLADMSLAEDVEADAGPDLTALGSGNVDAAIRDVADAVVVTELTGAVEARSDAEELFEAATHPAEPVQHDDAGDDALVPLAISAEQLIAALESGPSSFHEDEPKEKSLAESVLADRAPAEFVRRDLAMDPDAEAEGAERAPMIIERARAEMAAIAASEAVPARNSGAVGFFAGLSLSIAAGVVLYYTL
jgi:hypothetical protein